MTKRVKFRVQAVEMGCLRKVIGSFLHDMTKSTDIYQSLDIEPLLLLIEQSQLRWYGHVTQMPSSKQQSKKGLEGNPELAGEITLKIWRSHVLEFHQQNCR